MMVRLAAWLPLFWALLQSCTVFANEATDVSSASSNESRRPSVAVVLGGLYASGMTLAEIQDFLFETDWPDIFDPDTRRKDLSFRRKRDDDDFLIKYRVGIKDGHAQLPTALVPNGKLARLLQSTLAHTKGVKSFDQLPIPFRTVTMDLLSGEEVVLDSGSLDRAILATLTSPGTLPPVEIDDRLLITGSLLNNIPIDVAREWGADVVIVVDLGPY